MNALAARPIIQKLEQSARSLPDCDLRRRCEKLAGLLDEILKDPGPEWVVSNLRAIERFVFTRPSFESVPAECAEEDPTALYGLLALLDDVQHSMRQQLHRRFALRPIVAAEQAPYDEHSPRFTVNRTRATGNSGLDWCVAQTVALGFEWDHTPPVLRPARVDVYRSVESARRAQVWSVTPAALPCGRRVEVAIRGAGLGEVRSGWIGEERGEVVSRSEDLVVLAVAGPGSAGPVEVALSSLGDAQVPALHRESFQGFAVAYEPVRIEATWDDPATGTVGVRTLSPASRLVLSDDVEAGAASTADGTAVSLALPPGGVVRGTAIRRFSVLAGSADGVQELEVSVEETFVVVPSREGIAEGIHAEIREGASRTAEPSPPDPAILPPAEIPGAVGDAPGAEPEPSPTGAGEPPAIPASPAPPPPLLDLLLVGPGGERIPLRGLAPGTVLEIHVAPPALVPDPDAPGTDVACATEVEEPS